MLKLFLVRAMNNYFRSAHVVAVDKVEAAAKGLRVFNERCTASEVKVPEWSIRLEATGEKKQSKEEQW